MKKTEGPQEKAHEISIEIIIVTRPESDDIDTAGLYITMYNYARGAGIAQWLERQTRDRKVSGSNPGRSSGKVSSPGSVFCFCADFCSVST